MRAISIDSETSYVKEICMDVPFLLTTCDEQLVCKDLYPRTVGHYKEKAGWREKITKICSNTKILKVFHNAAYDIAMLNNLGIEVVEPWFDTMIAASILNENFSSKRLKDLALKYLGEDISESKELKAARTRATKEARKAGILGPKEDLPWHLIPKEYLVPYALKDPMYTMKLYYLFKKPLRKYQKVFDFEMALVPVVVGLYRNGMGIDRKFTASTLAQYTAEQDVELATLRKLVKKYGLHFDKTKTYKRYPKKVENWDIIKEQKDGTFFATKHEPFNPRSSHQKSAVLVHLKVPIGAETASGVSTDKTLLEPFANDYPFISHLLDYNWYEKQRTTYYEPFLRDHTTEKNNIAHFHYYQSAAKSGRFTAERIHQIPRMDEELEDPRVIRHCFIPQKGCWYVANDYDQIEMRLFAHYTKSKLLLDDFKNGRDPYTQVAVNVGKRIDIDIESMEKAAKKAWRRRGKQCCLGVIYGMGKNKTAITLKLPMMEALAFLRYFYDLYPVQPYMDAVTRQLYTKGFITIAFDSELMQFSIDKRIPPDLAYKGVNMIMQSTAGYVMKAGMLRCWHAIQNDKALKSVLTNKWTGLPDMNATIHDELIFTVHDKRQSICEEVTKEIQNLMDDRVTFRVPITTSPKISDKSWGAAKSIPGGVK